MEKKFQKPVEVEEEVEDVEDAKEIEDSPEEEITENEELDAYLDEEYGFIQEEYDEEALKNDRKGRSRKPFKKEVYHEKEHVYLGRRF